MYAMQWPAHRVARVIKHAAPELLADSAFMNRGYREHERKLRWLEAQLVRREHAARTYRKITRLNRMA